jgi:hypothetical protein
MQNSVPLGINRRLLDEHRTRSLVTDGQVNQLGATGVLQGLVKIVQVQLNGLRCNVMAIHRGGQHSGGA